MAEPPRSLDEFLAGVLPVVSFGIAAVDGAPVPAVAVDAAVPGGTGADPTLETSLQVWAGGEGPEDWLLRLDVARHLPSEAAFAVVLGLAEHRPLLDDMARAGTLAVTSTDPDSDWLVLGLDGDVLAALLTAIDGPR